VLGLVSNNGLVMKKKFFSRFFNLLSVFIPVFLFLLLKAYSAVPFVGDENIYYYAGYNVLKGVTPFSDMPFAHPPLHLLLCVLWMLPQSINPVWLKLASIFPATMSIIVLCLCCKKLDFSKVASFLAAMTYVLTYDHLLISTHFTGASWSAFLVILGFYCCLFKDYRALLGGVALASATLVSYHVIPVVGVLLCGFFFINMKYNWKVVVCFLATIVFIQLDFYLYFGQAYFEQLYSYHANKLPMPDKGIGTVKTVLYNSYPIFVWAFAGFIFAIIGLIKKYLKKEDYVYLLPVCLAFIAALLQFIAVVANQRVYSYYFEPVFVLAAFTAAWAFEQIQRAVLGFCHADFSKINAALVFVVGIITAFISGERFERELSYYNNSIGKKYEYTFKSSPVLSDGLNALVKNLFFISERVGGRWYASPTRYLWHEFSSPDPSVLLPALKKYQAIEGEIFGDASSTPYLALASGRKIALHMPDTNAQLLSAKIVDIFELIETLKQKLPVFMVVDPNRGIPSHPAFQKFVVENYKVIDLKNTAGETLILFGLKSLV